MEEISGTFSQYLLYILVMMQRKMFISISMKEKPESTKRSSEINERYNKHDINNGNNCIDNVALIIERVIKDYNSTIDTFLKYWKYFVFYKFSKNNYIYTNNISGISNAHSHINDVSASNNVKNSANIGNINQISSCNTSTNGNDTDGQTVDKIDGNKKINVVNNNIDNSKNNNINNININSDIENNDEDKSNSNSHSKPASNLAKKEEEKDDNINDKHGKNINNNYKGNIADLSVRIGPMHNNNNNNANNSGMRYREESDFESSMTLNDPLESQASGHKFVMPESESPNNKGSGSGRLGAVAASSGYGKRRKNHNNYRGKAFAKPNLPPLNALEASATDSRQDSIRSIAMKNIYGIGAGSNGCGNTNSLSSSGCGGHSIHSGQYSMSNTESTFGFDLKFVLGGQHSSHVFNSNNTAVRNQSTSLSLYNCNQYSGHEARLSPSPEPGAVNRCSLSPKILLKANAHNHGHGIGNGMLRAK